MSPTHQWHAIRLCPSSRRCSSLGVRPPHPAGHEAAPSHLRTHAPAARGWAGASQSQPHSRSSPTSPPPGAKRLLQGTLASKPACLVPAGCESSSFEAPTHLWRTIGQGTPQCHTSPRGPPALQCGVGQGAPQCHTSSCPSASQHGLLHSAHTAAVCVQTRPFC